MALLIATASSGRLVPRATTVNPIIRSLTPKAIARLVPPQTTSLALDTKMISEINKSSHVLPVS